MTKLFTRTLQSKSGLIFFAILAIYNLLLGIYLKDFLVLSPMLVTFYLLSALPPLLFVIRIRSAPMRAIVYIVLFFVLLMSTLSFVLCRRLLPIITMITTAAVKKIRGLRFADEIIRDEQCHYDKCRYCQNIYFRQRFVFAGTVIINSQVHHLGGSNNHCYDRQKPAAQNKAESAH